MSDQFKAIVLNQEGENFSREVKSLDKSFLKHGDVTVKVDYSDLNFKDGMILKNGGRLVKEYPHIPGIDFSGTVIQSDNPKFKEGDEVILTGFRVGEVFFGGFSQIAKVSGDFLVKKPNSLTSKQAMILGTAGLTSLMSTFAIQARESILLGEKVNDVLVTGATGGVGSLAVMALTKLGYNVTAVTGKDSKSDYLKSLGAKNIINRAEFDKDPRPIDKGLWDGVVDTVGGKILANAIAQTKSNGIIAVCGNANSNELNTNLLPFMLRGIKVWGMDSANCSIKRREFIWGEASKLIDFDLIEKSVLTVSLEELVETYPKILKGTAHEVISKLKEVETSLGDQKSKPTGKLTITTVRSFGTHWLTPRIQEFMTLNPEIEIELVFDDKELDLSTRQADIGIFMRRPKQLNYIQKKLVDIKYYIYGSNKYLEKNGMPKTVNDLNKHKFISFGKGAPSPVYNPDWALKIGMHDGKKRKSIMKVNSVSGLLYGVESGVGLAALPEYLVSNTSNIIKVLPKVEGPITEAHFVYPQSLKNTARVQAFRNFLFSKIGDWK